MDEFVYDKRFLQKLKEQDYLRPVLKGEEGKEKLAKLFPSLKKETLQKDMWKWENRVKTISLCSEFCSFFTCHKILRIQ